MRLIDKLKKKLKRLEWWNKNRNNVILWTMCPLALSHLIFSPFFPIVGIVSLSLYLVVAIVAGYTTIWNEEALPRKIDNLKGHIDTLQGVNKETLVRVEQELEDVKKQEPTTKIGKQEKKRLIQELIERNSLVEQALAEKEAENDNILTM